MRHAKRALTLREVADEFRMTPLDAHRLVWLDGLGEGIHWTCLGLIRLMRAYLDTDRPALTDWIPRGEQAGRCEGFAVPAECVYSCTVFSETRDCALAFDYGSRKCERLRESFGRCLSCWTQGETDRKEDCAWRAGRKATPTAVGVN